MTRRKQKNKSGFIALVSAVIISIILLLIVSNLNLTGFYTRSNVLDYELQERSSALAEGCADMAILKFMQDSGYAGSELVDIGADNCQIESITNLGGNKIATVKADYKNYVTKLKIVLKSTDASVISWEEI
jgi:hypothetical protein